MREICKKVAIGALIIATGITTFFYGIALAAGIDTDFLVYFRNVLTIVGGGAIVFVGIMWFEHSAEEEDDEA